MNIRTWISAHRRDIGIIAALLLVAAVPRLLDLGFFLTADEKTWIVRSYEFVRAAKDIRFNDMLQTTHPGVTTLWVSGIAITAKLFLAGIPFATSTMIYYVKAAQFPIALLNTLAIPAIYVCLLVLFRKSAHEFLSRHAKALAIFGALFIALDPFLIGYSRVIHVDALLGSFLTLAVLSTIIFARGQDRRWLFASAIFSALALLTKIPAIFIFPFFLTALIAFHIRHVFSRAFLVAQTRHVLLWGMGIVILILAIWPALLWVPNPGGNVNLIRRDVTTAATVPHNMEEDYSLKPLHYPLALLSRSSIVSLVGGIAALAALGILARTRKIPVEIALVAVYLAGFVLMMTLGAKKGDRYIVPAFFALDILAAFGIMWFASIVKKQNSHRIVISAALVSTLYLLATVVSYHPYALAYSNPLFPDNVSQELGWGEGLDKVAAWLNENHPDSVVASWYPEELDAFTSARVVHINAHRQNQIEFIILYKNMFGREPSHYANDFIDEYYKKEEPTYVVRVHGKEYAWVYAKPSYPNTIGDLNADMIVVQEVAVAHQGLAGFELLPATRAGNAKEGTLVVTVSKELAGEPLFTERVPVSELSDSGWHTIMLPEGVDIAKGDRIFITMRVAGSAAPYASVRYSKEPFRDTPIYISRTGILSEAEEKPGTLSVRMLYVGIDGKLATEYQTKLLR